MIEILLRLFYVVGIYLVIFLLLLKITILIIYKPKNWAYIFERLFIYHHRYVVRSEDYSRWGQFKTILNVLTFAIHLSILFLILAHFSHSTIN